MSLEPHTPIYLSPTQIMDLIPELKSNFGWNSKFLGSLAKKGVLASIEEPRSGKQLIRTDSLMELIDFTNHQLERRRVKVVDPTFKTFR